MQTPPRRAVYPADQPMDFAASTLPATRAAVAAAAFLRDAVAADAAALAAIYNPYVIASTVSFEEDAVDAAAMAARVAAVQALGLPWLVAESDGVIVGYAYATSWRVRPAYRYAVETSVYLPASQHRRGLGAQLLTALLERLRSGGLHLAIAGIALPNPASIALHERMGYSKAAHFREVGFKLGQWRDVAYWQLLLQQPEPPA